MKPMVISVPILKPCDALSAGLDARRKANGAAEIAGRNAHTGLLQRMATTNISRHQESGQASAAHEASSEAISVLRGRVKMIIKLMTARASSTKMLPSGPVVPPLINGVPTGWVAKR
jgi:hypothetical protein